MVPIPVLEGFSGSLVIPQVIEPAPAPHDARYLFEEFVGMMG